MGKNQINDIAVELNEQLRSGDGVLYSMLSGTGRRAFFPSRGILGQSAEAGGASINATIGTAFEEDGGPMRLGCLSRLLSMDPSVFLYAPSHGVRALREKWRDILRVKNEDMPDGFRMSLPVVTNAITHALWLAGELFVEKGDKLVIPDLYWDNYDLLFRDGRGARFVTFRTFAGARGKGGFNVDAMRKALLAPGDKKVLLLNFPNNPTGYTPTRDESARIAGAVREAAEAGKRIVVLVDDAYFGLVYEDGVSRSSLFPLLGGLHGNVLAVKLDGATKEDYVWGFRVGFITFARKGSTAGQLDALEQKAAGLVRGSISNVSNLGQRLLLKAYGSGDEYASQKAACFATLAGRYHEIRSILGANRRYAESFTAMPFNSGYFMCVKPRGVAAEAVRRRLVEKYSTGTVVVSGLLRIAFSSVPRDKLGRLFANIDAAVRDLKAAVADAG